MVPCSYPTSSSSPLSIHVSPSSAGSPYRERSTHADNNDLTMVWDIGMAELMHNYCTSTSFTASDNPALQRFIQINVPQIGFTHTLVLHIILAISALHLAHFKLDQEVFYLERGHRY